VVVVRKIQIIWGHINEEFGALAEKMILNWLKVPIPNVL
jgi:hypothetical protein